MRASVDFSVSVWISVVAKRAETFSGDWSPDIYVSSGAASTVIPGSLIRVRHGDPQITVVKGLGRHDAG